MTPHYSSSLKFQEQNFDIFAGDNDEPIIALHSPSTLCEDTSSLPPHSFVVQSNGHGIEALNGLCQKVRDYCMTVYSSLKAKMNF